MRDKKIVIVGGSIAGCAIAVLLQTLELDFIILEKSGGELVGGTGIFLPEFIIQQCIALNLFDDDIPRLKISERSFLRKEEQGNEGLFWRQQLNGFSLNWGSVYANLRKRILPSRYKTHAAVTDVTKIDDQYQLATEDGSTYKADLIIAADGINSYIRSYFSSETKPKYTRYYAWRGIIEDCADIQASASESHMPYYVFDGGHILLYPIPNIHNLGETLLNWVMYQYSPDLSLEELLIDKDGKQHNYSLSPGRLSEQKIEELREIATEKLPTRIAELIINGTKEPFIQAIFDCELPTYSHENVIFSGDAATVLRPHTASGVFKSLQTAIEFFNLLRDNLDKNISHFLEQWQFKQKEILSDEVSKAYRMGELLVTNTPEWTKLSQESMQKLWDKTMKGFSWYATVYQPSGKDLLFTSSKRVETDIAGSSEDRLKK